MLDADQYDSEPCGRRNAVREAENGHAKGIEPFPTAELTPYDPSFLSGFLAEENAIDLPEALESAKARMRLSLDRRDAGVRDLL
jgi:hypothetical protein